MAQEALTNVARHSGTDDAELRLAARKGQAHGHGADRGRGLRTGGEPGTGIRGMRERAGLIGASLDRRAQRGRRRLRGHVPCGRRVGGGPPMAPLKTRILLADDHALVRRGLELVLDAEPDLEVVAEAGDGAEAVELGLADGGRLGDHRYVDAADDRPSGRGRAAPAPARAAPLILSMHENERYLYEALKAGASGYVLKSAADRDLVQAARRDAGRVVSVPGRDHGAHSRLPAPGAQSRNVRAIR